MLTLENPKKSFRGPAHPGKQGPGPIRIPGEHPIDIHVKETATEYIWRLPVPGYNRENIFIEAGHQILSVTTGRKKLDAPAGSMEPPHKSVEWEKFFLLPPDADVIMATATCVCGELIIRIPKGNQAEREPHIKIYVY